MKSTTRKRLSAVTAAVILGTLGSVISQESQAATATSAVMTFPAVKILTVGDSITAGDGVNNSYRPELDRLLTLAGVSHTFVVAAVGGSPCEYWSQSAQGLATTHQPDIILLECGTNNLVNTDQSAATFESIYRQLMFSFLAGSSGSKLFPSFIQYSSIGGYPFPDKAPAWLKDSEPKVNDGIYRATLLSNPYWGNRVSAFTDFQQIPEAYLDEKGVHPTVSGYAVMARIWYNTLRASYGWPALAGNNRVPCGMIGHRPLWGSPTVAPITPGCPIA